MRGSVNGNGDDWGELLRKAAEVKNQGRGAVNISRRCLKNVQMLAVTNEEGMNVFSMRSDEYLRCMDVRCAV